MQTAPLLKGAVFSFVKPAARSRPTTKDAPLNKPQEAVWRNLVSDSKFSTEINDLPKLVDRVRDAHAAMQTVMCNVLHHALVAGSAICELRARGTSIAWISANCKLAIRTLHLYLELAEYRAEIEAQRTKYPELPKCRSGWQTGAH